jgi:hypothetical protein
LLFNVNGFFVLAVHETADSQAVMEESVEVLWSKLEEADQELSEVSLQF